MVSKIILILSALNSLALFAHDNFNHISANVGSTGLDSAHLKLNHQSYFYLPHEDAFILDLAHSLHAKHMQNDMGLAYRTFLGNVGIGANFYYMHTTRPKAFLHQFSPGLELFYKKWQASYNVYLPSSQLRDLKKGSIYHSPVSEFGLKWMPTNDFSFGILPFYDHLNRNFGINSNINYIFKERFNFGVSPYYKTQGSGVLFSFGISFGTAKDVKPIHRSNSFNYFVKDYDAPNPKISVEMPKSLPPIQTPAIEYPPIKPADIEKEEMEEEKPPQEPWNWWNLVPFHNYKGMDYAQKDEAEQAPSPHATNTSYQNDLLWIPPDPIRVYDALCNSSSPHPPAAPPPVMFEDYLPHPPQIDPMNPRHQSAPNLLNSQIFEDYQG